MNKFTPGPWKVGNKFEVGKVSDADDQSFGMIDPLADVYGENKEADAKLICAAPDLLDALIAINAQLEADGYMGTTYGPLRLAATKAIAKALTPKS